MSSTFCPDCEGEIKLNPPAVLGQKLACPHCQVDLEVIHLDPVWLDWTYVCNGEDRDEYPGAEWATNELSHGAWAPHDMS